MPEGRKHGRNPAGFPQLPCLCPVRKAPLQGSGRLKPGPTTPTVKRKRLKLPICRRPHPRQPSFRNSLLPLPRWMRLSRLKEALPNRRRARPRRLSRRRILRRRRRKRGQRRPARSTQSRWGCPQIKSRPKKRETKRKKPVKLFMWMNRAIPYPSRRSRTRCWPRPNG